MLGAALNRLIGMLTVMAIVVTIVFIIVRVTPGDPAAVMLGPDATAADVEALRQRLGLDGTILEQFISYVAGIFRGDLGQSIFLGQPVTTALWMRAEPTFFLTIFSLAIATVIALPIGVASAYWRGSWFDQVMTSLAMFAASVPSFWLGLIFIQTFAVSLGWFPTSGYGGPYSPLGERLYHLVLPATTLGIVSSALIMRFTRASMLDVLNDDYVRTARSKGMSEWQLTAALLISGAIVTETVFALPGVGNLIVSAVLRRDYPVIQGALLIVAGLYVLVNFVIDMLYLLVDPRVRY